MSILIEMPAIQFKGVKILVQNNDTGNKALYSIVNPDTGEVTQFTNLKTCKLAITDYLTTSDTGSINAPESTQPVYKVVFNKNNNYGNPSILPYTGTPEEIVHNIAVCSWFNTQTSLDYMLGYAARFKILTAIDLDTTTFLAFLQSLQFNHIITLTEIPQEV